MASATRPGLAQDPLFGESYRASSVLHSLGGDGSSRQAPPGVGAENSAFKLRLSDTPLGGDPGSYVRKGENGKDFV
jgi:hypothetical protein